MPRHRDWGRALLGDSGGFFVIRTNGKGEVAVSGFGSMRAIDLDGSRSVYVDNGTWWHGIRSLTMNWHSIRPNRASLGKFSTAKPPAKALFSNFQAKDASTSAHVIAAVLSIGSSRRCLRKRW